MYKQRGTGRLQAAGFFSLAVALFIYLLVFAFAPLKEISPLILGQRPLDETAEHAIFGIVALFFATGLAVAGIQLILLGIPKTRLRAEKLVKYWVLSLIVGIPSLFIMLIVMAILFPGDKYSKRADLFAAKESDFASISNRSERSGQPYLAGKIVTVYETSWATEKGNVRTRFYDIADESGVYWSLPNSLRAATPQEVKTIIWLTWDRELRGRYTRGGGGYQHKCTLTIMDKAAGVVVGKKTFIGSEPPKSVVVSPSTSADDHYGNRPIREIVDYLLSLPVKE